MTPWLLCKYVAAVGFGVVGGVCAAFIVAIVAVAIIKATMDVFG